jgi:hypothetical protein
MDDRRPKDWRELCELAAKELDPKKLMDLIIEINNALDERERKRKTDMGNASRNNHETSSFCVPGKPPIWAI